MPLNNLTLQPAIKVVPTLEVKTERASRQETDALLLSLSAGGDTAAFAALYDRLSGPLLAVIMRMLGDRAESEDVLQETFVQLWKKAGSYDAAQSTVFSWTMLMARGRSIDHLRRRTRRGRIIADTSPDDVPPPTTNDRETKNTNLDLSQCLDHLAKGEREVIDLAFFSGLTHEEIAEQLTQPLGTVKARIRRGLIKLRTYFSRET